MPWIRRMLRDTKVFVRARKDGSPDAGRDGRVDIKYKLDENAKVYRAAVRNPLRGENDESREGRSLPGDI